MKKVAATRGHKVRRIEFFLGMTANLSCGLEVDALTMANFYGFLPGRLTLTTPSPLVEAPGLTAISGHFGEVSSQAKHTAI
jgi:hypothetical protein